MEKLRQRQAAATRSAILDAAGRRFQQDGYEATRIEDVAASAGVAVPTVYKIFTSKRKLLAAVVRAAMSGEVEAPIARQPWWREQLAEPDPVRQLELIARNARLIYERAAGALELLRGTAASDPDLEALARSLDDERYRRSLASARALAAKGALRLGMDVNQAARTLWTLTAPELYLLQVRRRSVRSSAYEAWLRSLLRHALLPD